MSETEIQTWLIDYVARETGVVKAKIESNIAFDRYGMDSSAAVGMTGDLEDWLHLELEPTVVYDYPTIAELSKYLAARVQS